MEGPTAKQAEKIAKKTREEKLREQKIESEILKSLNAIAEPDQKFQALLHRCVEAERISRSAQLQQKQNQKTIETLLLEKDNLSAEYQRIMLTKSKLESLCRELQSQNKTIKVRNFMFFNLKTNFYFIFLGRFVIKDPRRRRTSQGDSSQVPALAQWDPKAYEWEFW